MIDFNEFKKSVKEWIRSNPEGTITDLRDYCEELIPSTHFSSHAWVIDQTVSWYRHILNHRDLQDSMDGGEEMVD